MTIPTYEELMGRCLARVSDDIDKREGSLIYTAVAPVCAELAQMYVELSGCLDLCFADTSSGGYLDKAVKQYGITRKTATCAVRKGVFLSQAGVAFDVPNGSRFGIDGLFFTVTSKIETGSFYLTCETAGTEGNQCYGALLPVDYLAGFGSAALTDIYVAAADEETDDELKERFFTKVSEPAFGGNIADYKEKTKAIIGVTAVKVTPDESGAGTVLITILGSGYLVPDASLVGAVQNTFFPGEGQDGTGLAPIGHNVTVSGATADNISVSATVTLQSGYTAEGAAAAATSKVNEYFLSLREDWENNDTTVVRLSQVSMSILSAEGILDVQDTKINSAASNLQLGEYEIPMLSGVTLSV